MPILTNHPQLKKVQFGDAETVVTVYGGAIHLQDKLFKRKKTLRIVLKSADAIGGPGVLFKFLKLTMQAQESTFENLITSTNIQAWFLQAAKNYIRE